ncbi:hypothetical protein SKAU_G00248830 [Synaphobranchus kaupii]|uniref:DUF4218 domain-containing protein n=1 Tax=Synaphobranchus kaupii TaxID=118154 RepID=A0A9Q1F2G1_SYNKA|nr:hypothetical protein SKAU_G00248830 [Synaphobranchus kaupii]
MQPLQRSGAFILGCPSAYSNRMKAERRKGAHTSKQSETRRDPEEANGVHAKTTAESAPDATPSARNPEEAEQQRSRGGDVGQQSRSKTGGEPKPTQQEFDRVGTSSGGRAAVAEQLSNDDGEDEIEDSSNGEGEDEFESASETEESGDSFSPDSSSVEMLRDNLPTEKRDHQMNLPYHNEKCSLIDMELKEADRRATAIIAPLGSSFIPGPVFSVQSLPNTSAIHEFQIGGLFQWCLKAILQQQPRRSLIMWLKANQYCYQDSFTAMELQQVEEIACALMERDWPLTFQNITTHLLLHLPQSIRENGPMVSTWMFPFERSNSWVIRRALNKRDMASTIMRTYQVLEFTLFMLSSGMIPDEIHQNSHNQAWTKLKLTSEEAALLSSFYKEDIEKK